MSIKAGAVVGFTLFTNYLIYGLIVPLTPSAGNSGADAALLYTVYTVGVLAATPVFAYLGDRSGYRRPMIWGVALSGLTVALLGAAPGYELQLLARLLQGAADTATWTAGLALIAVHYPSKRTETMGYVLTASNAGLLVGPIIGGTLYDFGGYQLPFAATGALVAIDIGLCIGLLPRETRSAGRSGAEWGSAEGGGGLRALLFDRAVLVWAAAVALAAISDITEPLLPAQLASAGASPLTIGVIFTAATIVYGLATPVVGFVAERIAVRKVVIGGTLAMAATMPLLGLLPGVTGAAVALCANAAAYAFMLNPTAAELANAVDRRGLSCYGAVYGVYNIAYAVGQMAGDGFASAAAPRMSFLAILLWTSAALILFTPLLMLWGNTSAAPAARRDGAS